MISKDDFIRYHVSQPLVWSLFEEYSLRALSAGVKNFGSMAILNRIRWEYQIEKKKTEFAVNNNYAPVYARLFEMKYPEHKGFFETRASDVDSWINDLKDKIRR